MLIYGAKTTVFKETKFGYNTAYWSVNNHGARNTFYWRETFAKATSRIKIFVNEKISNR